MKLLMTPAVLGEARLRPGAVTAWRFCSGMLARSEPEPHRDLDVVLLLGALVLDVYGDLAGVVRVEQLASAQDVARAVQQEGYLEREREV